MKLKTFMRELEATVERAKSVSAERAAGMEEVLGKFKELFSSFQIVKRPEKKGRKAKEAAVTEVSAVR